MFHKTQNNLKIKKSANNQRPIIVTFHSPHFQILIDIQHWRPLRHHRSMKPLARQNIIVQNRIQIDRMLQQIMQSQATENTLEFATLQFLQEWRRFFEFPEILWPILLHRRCTRLRVVLGGRMQLQEQPLAQQHVQRELGLNDKQIGMADKFFHEIDVDLAQPFRVFGVETQQIDEQPVEGGFLDALDTVSGGRLKVCDGSLKNTEKDCHYTNKT